MKDETFDRLIDVGGWTVYLAVLGIFAGFLIHFWPTSLGLQIAAVSFAVLAAIGVLLLALGAGEAST